jgi:hypothetical protein
MKELNKILEAKNGEIDLLRWENERLRRENERLLLENAELKNDIEKYKENEVKEI